MSLNSNNFRHLALETVKEEFRAVVWPVWTKYELHEFPSGVRALYAPAGYLAPGADERFPEPDQVLHNALLSTYRPLVDTPELFLEFACLADGGGLDEELGTDKNAAAALGWAEAYGVLGLTPLPKVELVLSGGSLAFADPRKMLADSVWTSVDGALESILAAEATVSRFSYRVAPQSFHRAKNPRGGEREAVQRFSYEAWIANVALRLYEAATAPSGTDVKAIQAIRELMPSLEQKPLPATESALENWALEWVANAAQSRIGGDVFPLVYEKREGFAQGWGFDSLLGAMWLQLMWLLTAGSNVRKCEGPGCAKVITFDRPELPKEDPGTKKNARGPYKTRIDKRFCSHNCLVKKRYHDKKSRHEQPA